MTLTPLQEHMLRELVKGRRLCEIATERGISRQGMNAMANYVRVRLGLRTPFQLGAWAERHGYGAPEQGGS